MAVSGKMAVNAATIGGVEILNRPVYEAVPMTLDGGAFAKGAVKAGSVIKKDGTVSSDGSEAVGILLTDVYKDSPQGTILKKAYVNLTRVKESLGEEYSTAYADVSTIAAALPMIVFEDQPGE